MLHRAVALALLVSPLAFGQAVTGRVVGVHDGDSITLLTEDKQRLRVRLADIDAPELGQPFGRAAKGELSGLCFNRDAAVVPRLIDQYGRTVGVVTCDGRDASSHMVERGMAWAYRMYLLRPELLPLEATAKASALGLWADSAVPPWEYREHAKAQSVAARSAAPRGRPAAPPSQPSSAPQ